MKDESRNDREQSGQAGRILEAFSGIDAELVERSSQAVVTHRRKIVLLRRSLATAAVLFVLVLGGLGIQYVRYGGNNFSAKNFSFDGAVISDDTTTEDNLFHPEQMLMATENAKVASEGEAAGAILADLDGYNIEETLPEAAEKGVKEDTNRAAETEKYAVSKKETAPQDCCTVYLTGEEQDPAVYLTFECADEESVVDEVLDILKKRRISAVFFVTDVFREKNGDIVKRIGNEGHVVAAFGSKDSYLTEKLAGMGLQKDSEEALTSDGLEKLLTYWENKGYRFGSGKELWGEE